MKLLERIDARARLKSRGFCVGPLNAAPFPGSVGLDKRAACRLCGKRVMVTARGRFMNHTPAEAAQVKEGERG